MDHRLIGATVTSIFLSQIWDKPQALYYYGSPAQNIENERSKKLRGVDESYLTTKVSYTDEDFELAIKAISKRMEYNFIPVFSTKLPNLHLEIGEHLRDQ